MDTARTYIGADNQVHDQYGNTYAQQGLKGTINGELGTTGTIEPPAAKPAVVTAPVTTPTVVTNANITDKKIPQINAEATKVLTPPTVAPAPDATTTEKTKDDGTGGYSDIYKSLMGDSTTDAVTDPYYKSQMDLIDSMKTSNDSIFQNTLSGIRSQYQSAYSTQEKANRESNQQVGNALLRSGSSRYAPGSSAAYMSAKNAADISALNDLHTKEQAAISEASVAKMNGDYKTLEAKLGVVKEIRAEKQAQAKAIFEQMAADAKAKRDAEVKKQEEISKIALEARKNGASDDTIEAITNAESVNDAIKAGGDTLQSGTGTVGEYLYYKRDALAHKQVPMSYNEYADMDANRKRSVINVGVGGLTNQQAQLATKLSDDYEQRSTDFYKLRAGYNQVVSSAKDPTGAGDISLLYGYMKMLDPNSVVRETEFATAQNAGSIPENIRAKYNAAVNGKKLSDVQRNDFVNQANKVYTSAKKQQDEVKSEFDSRADKYGVPADLVTRSTEATGSVAANAIQDEATAKAKAINVAKTNPTAAKAIRDSVAKGYRYSDIIVALPEFFVVK